MIKYRGWWTALGFLVAGTGFLALILSLVGVRLSFLGWLEGAGPLAAFLGKILMILGGIVAAYVAQTDWNREEI